MVKDIGPKFLKWNGTQYVPNRSTDASPLGSVGGDLIGFYSSPQTIKSTFVYRDSEPNPSGNVYASFASAYAARKLIKGSAVIEIDDTLNSGNAQITPGIYDLTDTFLGGINSVPTLATALTCIGGNVTLQNLAGLKNVALQTNSTTTPNIIVNGTGFKALYLYNSSLTANNSAPILSVQNVVLYIILEAGSIIATGNTSAINLINPATLGVLAYGTSRVNNNSISGAVGTTLVPALDATSTIGTLSGFLGVLDTILLDKSPNVGYTPGTPGNWSPVPNNVSDALDQLSGETHALNGDVTGPIGSNTVIKIQGTSVSSASVTNDGYALVSIGDVWTPTGVAPILNVKNFGAKGNNVADDTVSIQAAFNSAANAALISPAQTCDVFFPAGTFKISSMISVPPRIRVVGSGHNGHSISTITASGGFSGAALLNLVVDGLAASSHYQSEIVSLQLIAGGSGSGIAAIQCVATFMTNCWIHNLTISGGLGLQFGSQYAQMCLIEDIFYTGTSDQALKLAGNINTIRRLDTTGVTAARSTSSLPVIHLIQSPTQSETVGNIIEQCVIEGDIGVNQTPLRIEGCQQTTVRNLWVEDPLGGNGHWAEIVNCIGVTRFEGNPQGLGQTSGGGGGTFILYARTSGPVLVDSLIDPRQDVAFQTLYDFDATPFRIDQATLTYGDETYKIIRFDNSIPYVEVAGAYMAVAAGITGLIPQQRVDMGMRHNLLINGSFDAGLYGWTVTGASGESDVFQAGTVGPGQGWHSPFNANPSGHITIYQSIVINSAQLHVPMTFSIKAQIGGTSWANVWIQGCGINISGTNLSGHVQRINGNQGWSIMSQSFIPQSAGTLQIGVEIPQNAWHNSDTLWLDEANLCFGMVGHTNQGYFGALALSSGDGGDDAAILQLYGNAPPSTGTWPAGSIVWNNAAGIITGWKCVIAGSPGTWQTFSTDPFFNIKNYGAVSDDTTDCTTFINNALTASTNLGTVFVPAGTYHVGGTIVIGTGQSLVLDQSAELHKHSSDSATSIIRMTGVSSRLSGKGTLKADLAISKGILHIGPNSQSVSESIEFLSVNDVHIQGNQTSGNGDGSVGLYMDSSEPISGGNNYQNNITGLYIQAVDEGIHCDVDINAHSFYGNMFLQIGKYSYHFIGGSENTIYGGFTSGSQSALSIIKVENSAYDLFYGVQAEPGGSTCHYFDIDGYCSWVQVHGHNNCPSTGINAGLQSIITANGQGFVDTGSGTYFLGDGSVIVPPINLEANQLLTIKEFGNTPVYVQLGPIGGTVGSSVGAVYLGNPTATNNNFTLAGDDSSLTVVNVPTGGVGYLRINNTSPAAASWVTNGTNATLRLDGNFLYAGTATPTTTNHLLYGDGTSLGLINAPSGGTVALRVNNTNQVAVTAGSVIVTPSLLQVGTAPATTGNLAVPNNTIALAARNALNNNDISLITTNSSNTITIGDHTQAQNVILDGGTAAQIIFNLSGSQHSAVLAGTYRPAVDNAISLGLSSNRWSNVYTYNLNTSGSVNFITFTIITSSYTVDSGSHPDCQLFCNRAGAITINLPAPTAGRTLFIKDISGTASTNNITISQHASEKIDGQNTVTINSNYGSITLSSDGTNWFIL